MGFLRRIRGILGTGLAWALAWAGVGIAIGVYAWLRLPTAPRVSPLVFFPLPVAVFTVFGAVSGAAFATTLAVAERRRSLDDLSVRQTACWGALGGLLLPTVMVGQASVGLPPTAVVTMVGLGMALGAGTAAGTLLLARRGSSVPDLDDEPALRMSATGKPNVRCRRQDYQ